MKRNRKKITGAFLGTIVEYYDYSLYAFSAGILASKFFPGVDKMESLMYIFAIYAFSYLAKPIGSIFFSRIGDLYGRKVSLRITMLGIAIPTLTIGLLPDYNSVGFLSTQILILCRFFQGFFVAGEYDGAALYVIEHLGEKHHYTASGIARSTGVFGLLLGIASTNFFNSSIFPEWGWRIPFLLSMPLAMVTMYYRKYLEETPDFIKAKENGFEFTGIRSFIKKRWRILLMVMLLAGGFGVTYQISIVFMKQYLPIIEPKTGTIITAFSIIIVLIFGMTMPIAGFMADKFSLAIVIKTSVIMTLLSSGLLIISIYSELFNLMLIACIFLAASVAPFNALAHGVIVNVFSVNERYRGLSLGHTTGSMLLSGTANFVCLYCMQKLDAPLFPIFYIAFFAIITFFMLSRFDSRNK
jgi:MFS transporter, MHS family, proline/betaine transporter